MYEIVVMEKYQLSQDPPSILNVKSQSMEVPKPGTPKGNITHSDYVLKYLLKGLRKVLTDEEIKEHITVFCMRRTAYAIKYCIRKDIRTVNLSSEFLEYDVNPYAMAGQDDTYELEKELAKTCLMFAGAGNDGDETDHQEAMAASRDAWIGVGALDSNLVPRPFSSWGGGHVEFSGIDGTIDNKKGTSYATPYMTGIAAGIQVKCNILTGVYPDRGTTYKWLVELATDVGEPGVDLKTGHGVIVDIVNLEDKIKLWRKLSMVEKASEWATEAQEFVIEKELSDGTRPGDTVTREELWVMLKRFHDTFIDKE